MNQDESANMRTSTVRSWALSVALMSGLAFTGLLAPPLHARTDCEDVSGSYEVLVDLPGGGPTPLTITLEQSDCEVAGFVEGQHKTPIDDGVVDGSTATFTAEAINQGGGNTLVIGWTITVDGDDVIGTFSHDMIGSIDFVGTRATPG